MALIVLSLTDLTTLRPDIPVIKAFRDELYGRLASDDISTQRSFDYRDIEQSSGRLTTRNMLGEKIIENENQAQQIAGMGGLVTDLQHALATKTAEALDAVEKNGYEVIPVVTSEISLQKVYI